MPSVTYSFSVEIGHNLTELYSTTDCHVFNGPPCVITLLQQETEIQQLCFQKVTHKNFI